ncbi:Sec20-domain-containing protein [Violaceomyces palustris]|uniref:Sec20-domain-containing protein n=1 Tax=Violaceomyces palustris TaxID=1673888 RepID=A0ACD0P0F7_9BASI|nr:Sec20-domain-containing protein [Violaceomyces palustris]
MASGGQAEEEQQRSSWLPPDALALAASIDRNLNEIKSFQIPRLQSSTEQEAFRSFEIEVNSSVEIVKELVQELELIIEDADDRLQSEAIAKVWAAKRSDLELVRQQIRNALLTARRSIQASKISSAREELRLAAENAKELAGGRTGSRGDDKLQTTSQDVTDALRRTVALMSQELEKSSLSNELLSESSNTLKALSTQYGSLSDLLSNSAQMIRTMEREDLYGKAMVAFSMLFFVSCVFYILYVRVLSKGVGIIAFLLRILGFGRLWRVATGSMALNAKDEMALAKETLKASVKAWSDSTPTPSQVATTAMSAASVVTTAITTAIASKASEVLSDRLMDEGVATTVFDLNANHDEAVAIEEEEEGDMVGVGEGMSALLDEVERGRIYEGNDPLTRKYTLPTARVEL